MKIEKEYIVGLKNGSTEAFDAIYSAYHGRVYNFVLKVAGGDKYIAEEVVQCAFVKLWEVREKIDENKSLLSYLCTIAKNQLLNNHSHKLVEYVYQEYIMKMGSSHDLSTENEVDRSLLEQLITELAGKLPPARQKIFIMSRREGKSNKEIAKILNITESTIETQLSKAIEFMKSELKKYYSMPSSILIMFFINFLIGQ